MRQSAGLICYRHRAGGVEIFLVHPGGPFWRNKDARGWSIPKGEFTSGEAALEAAKREFSEETGIEVDRVMTGRAFIAIPPAKQPGGKVVHAFAVEADFDADTIRSNMFSIEWPPRSGKRREFPEVDRAAWFGLDVAAEKLHAGQAHFPGALRAALTTRTTRGEDSP